MASVARPRQRHVELALDHGMDEFASPITETGFDGIKPIVEKMALLSVCRLRKLRLSGNGFHGVVSYPALQRQVIRG